ncbi:Qat anti-phage system associated protein QatB [Tenacibaculum sp. SDUM215027]|uniref:Qat anti-phage system associated protein QatB n=1 Tax=Tenacibaculum sp. SDUM215027 TaxID=3422596 RepID=UPI003D317B51
MGTSTSSSGPGKTPLLPDWFEPDGATPDNNNENDENSENNNADDNRIESWRSAKTNLTSYIKNRSASKLRQSARSYINNYGGAKKASSTAIVGKATASKFIGFVNSLSNNGFNSTAENYGIISFDGLDVKSVFAILSNELAPDGDTPEAAVARAAITETLCDIYKEIEEEGNADFGSLDTIMKDKENEYVIKYLSNYIFFRWVHELGETLERKDISANELINIENEMKAFINSSLEEKWKRYNLKSVDFKTSKGKQLIDSVFQQAYLIIESI